VLAAVENAIPADLVDHVRARAIVAGANRAVDAETSRRLEQRGIVVVPSLVGSLGTLNSLGVTTSAAQLRDRIVETVHGVTSDVFARADAENIPVDLAAEALARDRYREIEAHST
jgi:glutamate dehydrogenase/leucine dehydrogenase